VSAAPLAILHSHPAHFALAVATAATAVAVAVAVSVVAAVAVAAVVFAAAALSSFFIHSLVVSFSLPLPFVS
jgi:hypothetical protein